MARLDPIDEVISAGHFYLPIRATTGAVNSYAEWAANTTHAAAMNMKILSGDIWAICCRGKLGSCE